MLAGLNPEVDSIGIMTAWNPRSKAAKIEDNERATVRLRRDLRKGGLGRAISIGGMYEDLPEGSLLIPHITREFLLQMCMKYNQSTVIYGEKIDKDGEPGFHFEMLDRDGNIVTETDEPVTGKEEIYDAEKFYSYLKGKTPHQRGRKLRDPMIERTPRDPGPGNRRDREDPGNVPPTRKRFLIPFP
jgi:hypothetical protein